MRQNACLLLLIVGCWAVGSANAQGATPETIVVTPKARAVHERSFVFDGHNDLPWYIRNEAPAQFEQFDIAQRQTRNHTDIPRLREGGVGAQFWSVYVPPHTAKSGKSYEMTLEQIDLVHAMVRKYPATFELANTADDVLRIQRSGRIASLIGVEGGHSIENSIDKLQRLFELGARYMTLTHNDTLEWADSSTDEAKSGGLSEFGRAIVAEMNRLGMLVDLSHVSLETMQDALDTSKAPVIFSHSSARAVADHVRNVPDDILQQLPENGGVAMINFYSGFVVPESAENINRLVEQSRQWFDQYGDDEEAIKAELSEYQRRHPLLPGTVHDVADHVEHVVKVAGINHVGIGGDFDGVQVVPKQLEDVSMYPVLTQVLLDRGWNEEAIHKLMSGNILRVMQVAEELAARLRVE